MNTAAILLKEIETMPEEIAVELLNFALFLKSRHTQIQRSNTIAIKDAYGIFKDLKGMDTTIERDEEERL